MDVAGDERCRRRCRGRMRRNGAGSSGSCARTCAGRDRPRARRHRPLPRSSSDMARPARARQPASARVDDGAAAGRREVGDPPPMRDPHEAELAARSGHDERLLDVSNMRTPSGSSACARTKYLPGRSGSAGNSASKRVAVRARSRAARRRPCRWRRRRPACRRRARCRPARPARGRRANTTSPRSDERRALRAVVSPGIELDSTARVVAGGGRRRAPAVGALRAARFSSW